MKKQRAMILEQNIQMALQAATNRSLSDAIDIREVAKILKLANQLLKLKRRKHKAA